MRPSTSSLAIRVLALLAILLGAALLAAQEYRGLILGRVTDPTGAVVPAAVISAKGEGQTYTAKTGAGGDFTIAFC